MSYSREQIFVRTQAKPMKPRPRQQQGHFDPEELTRRLYLVLADQKAHAERKRARAEEAKLKDARSWASRHTNKEGGSRRSKEIRRDTVAPPSSKSQTSVKPADSALGGELRTQESPRLSTQGKESRPNLAKETSKATPDPPPAYHHVPQEAAKQFSRTTTVDGMRDGSKNNLAHKISKQALKAHLAAGAAAHASTSTNRAGKGHASNSPIERSQSQPNDRAERDRVQERHRVYRPKIPAEVSELDEEREEYHIAPQRQHTFQAELSRMMPHEQKDDQHRRNSTGDILARAAGEDNRFSMVLVERPSLADVLEDSTPVPDPDPAAADEHRVDWTQSDELAAPTSTNNAPAQRHKPLRSPLLRKADSIWTLRGRLGSGSKGSAAQEKGDMAQISESPKSPKAGFFAKFKR